MKIISKEDLLKHTLAEIENIDIDEYSDTELALLVQNELALADELEQNNIIFENNNLTFEKLLNENRNK
jgi:hypothetical protein